MPSVNVDSFGCVLEAFAKATGAGEGKQVVVVLDRAGWHTSSQVELPQGLHLVFQPASSPELQPAEHLWGLISEVLANKLLKTIDEVEQLVAQRCIWMGEQLELIRSRTLFSWWPALC
jgi:transposase